MAKLKVHGREIARITVHKPVGKSDLTDRRREYAVMEDGVVLTCLKGRTLPTTYCRSESYSSGWKIFQRHKSKFGFTPQDMKKIARDLAASFFRSADSGVRVRIKYHDAAYL